jgi:hypothetical protein
MSRRSLLLALATLLLLLCVGGGLVWLVTYEQAWYVNADVPPGEQRHKLSEDFVAGFFNLRNSVLAEQKEWGARFTDAQLNSYFAEGFVQSGLSALMLPENVSRPRVVFEPDRIRLAFRYGSGAWSTLISIDLCVYLIRGEPNAVALELEGFHAGALPFSAQSLLERISESDVGQQNGVEVSWYRHPDNGHPVAVVRFQSYQRNSPFQLEALQLVNGALTIRGRSGDPSAMRAMLVGAGLPFDAPQ